MQSIDAPGVLDAVSAGSTSGWAETYDEACSGRSIALEIEGRRLTPVPITRNARRLKRNHRSVGVTNRSALTVVVVHTMRQLP